MTNSPPTPAVQDQTRNRRAFLVSALAHTALLSALVLYEPPPVAEGLTEITFLDAPALTAPPLPIEFPPEETESPPEPMRVVKEEPAKEPEHFARVTPKAEVAPRPQSVEKLRDDVRDRLLTAVTPDLQTRTKTMFAAAAVPDRSSPRGTGISASSSAEPVALSRGTRVARDRPIALGRGTPRASSSSALAQLERVVEPDLTGGSTLAGASDSTAVRELSGASLAGPVADRVILHYPSPEYPEWAKHSAMEGSVGLHFTVTSDGTVRSNILVQKTSGVPEFDVNAVTALQTWRFQALPPGATGDQWGSVTFNYRLRDVAAHGSAGGE
jgi:TonB family protein